MGRTNAPRRGRGLAALVVVAGALLHAAPAEAHRDTELLIVARLVTTVDNATGRFAAEGVEVHGGRRDGQQMAGQYVCKGSGTSTGDLLSGTFSGVTACNLSRTIAGRPPSRSTGSYRGAYLATGIGMSIAAEERRSGHTAVCVGSAVLTAVSDETITQETLTVCRQW